MVGFVEGVDVLAAGVEPGQHVREVIGLAAGVAEIGDLEALAQELAQMFAVLAVVLVQVDRRNMHKFLHLVSVYGIEPGMAVADIDRRNTAGQVDELPAGLIVQVLHVAPDCEEGLLVVGLVEGEHVLAVQLEHLLAGDALVGLWLEGGKSGEGGGAQDEVLHGVVGSALNILRCATMAKDLNIYPYNIVGFIMAISKGSNCLESII